MTDKSKRLTLPQIKELTKLATGVQETHGRTRARVQNSLREKGFARLFNADGRELSVAVILVGVWYDRCDITDAGRTALEQDPGAQRFRKRVAEHDAWRAEYDRRNSGEIINGTKVFVDEWDGTLGEIIRYSESVLNGAYFVRLEFQRTDWFEADRVFVATPEQIAAHDKALEEA